MSACCSGMTESGATQTGSLSTLFHLERYQPMPRDRVKLSLNNTRVESSRSAIRQTASCSTHHFQYGRVTCLPEKLSHHIQQDRCDMRRRNSSWCEMRSSRQSTIGFFGLCWDCSGPEGVSYHGNRTVPLVDE